MNGEMLPVSNWVDAYSSKFHKHAALVLTVIVLFSLIYHALPILELTVAALLLLIALVNLTLKDSRASKQQQAILTIVIYLSVILVICYWNVKHYI